MKFKITGRFGELSPVRNWQSHSGIDFGMPEGTTLRAVKEGTVRLADYGMQNAGKTVLIDSKDGHTYIYGHLHDFVAKNGQHVNVGDVIAHSGNTGHSTASHLHFGMKDTATGKFEDPTSLAEKVANYAGNDFHGPGSMDTIIKQPPWWDIWGNLTWHAREHFGELILDFLGAINDVMLALLDNIVLLGGSTLIILGVSGFKKGYRYAFLMFMARILIKTLLGGNV